MKILVTGGFGFLGWHVACRLRARHGEVTVVRLGRSDLDTRLKAELADADVVLHLAGVNRAATPEEVSTGNTGLAALVADAVRGTSRPVGIAYANSTQSRLDNAYGQSKAAASDILAAAAQEVGGWLVDVVLPNLFGEHGRPHYNSFVATFVHELAAGRTPTVLEDRSVHLLHAQQAAAALVDAALGRPATRVVVPAGEEHAVSDVLATLQDFHGLYAHGDIPDLGTPFARDLFNTYRAAVFPAAFPRHPTLHSDERGTLFESCRSHGSGGQSFVSTTRPGQTRGQHYHLHRIERFVVVQGEAEISLRRLLTDEQVSFRIGGDRPAVVDMPTMWVHNLRNTGSTELVTVFWSDQLLTPGEVDQYPEAV